MFMSLQKKSNNMTLSVSQNHVCLKRKKEDKDEEEKDT